jgi:hypothetical protein
MHARLLIAASVFGPIVLCTACQVEGSMKASATANEARSEQSEQSTFSGSTPAAPAPAAPPVVAVAAPADACPLSCFEARGSERANVTAEEQAQLRTALEPVIGRMRSCTSPEEWRRRGSPVINLRLAPDGTLSDLGVDPHHSHESRCVDESGRSGVSVSLPGRKVVRCSERCVRETPRRRGNRRR